LSVNQAEDSQSMIHMTAEGVDRHVHMVNDILELERLESGKLRLLYAFNPRNVALE